MKLISFEEKLTVQYRSKAWLESHVRNVVVALCLLAIVMSVGIVGFSLIENWTFHDSFYMTVITLSTVGYGEVQPLSKSGQLFAAFLILGGMLTVAYAVGVIARSALEGELYKFRRVTKMAKEISELRNHIIVCGFGRLARFVIPDLLERGRKIVVIESNPESIELIENQGILFIEGNAYEDDTLKAAGIEHAQALVAVLPKDADNVFVTLSARSLNPKVRIIARTELVSGENKLRLAGANQVVAPYRVSGSRIVEQITHPYVNDFLEIATAATGEKLVLEQVVLPRGSELDGATLRASALKERTGATVAALIAPDGSLKISPVADEVLEGGSTLIAFGSEDGIQKLSNLLASE